MARIRTIKPEFFTSEQVMEISPLSRLLFIGIWPFCDDHGVHVASTKTLKAEVFPADDISLSDIENLMSELFSQRLVVEYSANGRNYWHITGWERHQKIEKPNYKHPFPYEQNQIVTKESPTIRRPFADHSTTESNGMESNGVEEEERKKTLSVSQAKADTIPYGSIIESANSILGKKYRATEKHKSLIRARWSEGYRECDFDKVCRNMAVTWGADAKMQAYLRPETLFGTKMDGYLNTSPVPCNQRQDLKTIDQIKMERLKQNMVDFLGGDYDGPGQETVCLVDG